TVGLIADMTDVDPAQLRVILGRPRERPVPHRGEQAGDREADPVESHAEDERGDEGTVHQPELALGAGEQERSSQRRMDRCAPRLVHQKVAPAQPIAVMKLSAPRASAPPKATPNKRLAPDPCSVNAKTSPVTIT